MTLNEITTIIAEGLKRPLDDPFKLMTAERVEIWRSRLIRNSVDKDERERKHFKQTIFVPMKSQAEIVCNVPFDQCNIAISKCAIPKPLRANNIYYDYVGNITGTKAFKQFTTGTLEALLHGKYSKNTIWFKVENDQLKIWNKPEIPVVMIEAIFDSPQEAAKFNCTCGITAECDFFNQEYPVSNDILQLIIQSIAQVDFNQSSNAPSMQIPVTKQQPEQ